MKLNQIKTYKSIKSFGEIELPNFVIITGINGSGKTQLLEAINREFFSINHNSDFKSVLFDSKSFVIKNFRGVSALGLADSRAHSSRNASIEKICNSINARIRELNQKTTATEKSVIRNYLKRINSNEIKESKNQGVYRILYDKINNFFDEIDTQLDSNFFQFVKAEIKRNPFIEIEYDLLFNNINILPTGMLSCDISELFWRYYYNVEYYKLTYHQKYKHIPDSAQIISMYGQKPWEVFNNILSSISDFGYQLRNPEGLDLFYGSYNATLISRDKSEIKIEELSSGEKILFSLALILFSNSRYEPPNIVLLDEIDSSLHPSMIKQLFEVIDTAFLQNDVQVIMVTHSPTTISLATQESVYLMDKPNQQLKKTTQLSALNNLTQGFATLSGGLKFFDELSKKDLTIITEGNNIEHIKQALRVLNPELESKVDIPRGLEKFTGQSQLKTLYDFAKKLSHEKKLLFVWDCDAIKTFNKAGPESTLVHKFIFLQNKENQLIVKGIENLYPEGILREYGLVDKTGSKDIFRSDSKSKLSERIKLESRGIVFEKFLPLLEKINFILKESSTTNPSTHSVKKQQADSTSQPTSN